MSPSGHFVGAWRTAAISGSGARNYPHRPILSRVCCIASFGDIIRFSSVLGFKLEMKFGLFLKTCCDESLPNRRCDLEELLLGKRRVPVSFKTDAAKTVADVEVIVLAIGHSPAVHLKAHGLRGHASRICLVTAGIKRIFVFWIEKQLDSKKCDE
jgi:hypothetical protein